jgi:acyl-CoA thioester hydrolase
VLELFGAGEEALWLGAFRFSVSVRPRVNEVDALGHVSNVWYSAYLEYGRMQYLDRLCEPARGPFGFEHVVAQTTLRFVARCYYDEPLEVLTRVTALGRSSATVEHAIVGTGTLRATAVVAIVRLGPAGPAPWSASQRQFIREYEAAGSVLDR